MKLKNVILILVLVSFGCQQNKNKSKNEIAENQIYLPLPLKPTSPPNNKLSTEKIALGKFLFFDPILSGNKDVACATCHHPKNGYAEFRDISIGVNGIGFGDSRKFKEPNTIPFLKRNAHTILNTAFNGINENGRYLPENAQMFWDNRVKSLEKQALEPIKSLEEMRGTQFSEGIILDTIINRLKINKTYKNLFQKAFPNETISKKTLSKAIASFERSLTTPNSRFDQYLRGDTNAISISEKEGFKVFKKVGCVKCHSGPMFSDYKLHTLGLPENKKLTKSDSGFNNSFKFRTPTLRNLRYTAPYMHNGKFVSLLKVLEFYEDMKQGKQQNPNIPVSKVDTLIKKLTIEVKDMRPIISFINTLNDDKFDKKVPNKVPSGLPVGGNIN